MPSGRRGRYTFRLGSRPELPPRPAQLLLRQTLLFCVAIFSLHQTLGKQSVSTDTVQHAIRHFIAWNLPVSAFVHIAFAALHEGGHVGYVVKDRIKAIALTLPIGFAIFLWLSVMFGISLMTESLGSAHWAALLSTLVVAPMAAIAGLDGNRWQYVFVHWHPSGTDELSAAVPAFGAIAGTFLGAFPMPLDWGSKWQIWPVSSVVGAFSGYVLGIIICLPLAIAIQCKQSR